MENLVLRERTVVLTGGFGSVVQGLMSRLTAEGADVAYVDKSAPAAQRFCTQLTDQREINSKFGRAMAIGADTTQLEQVKDALGKAAQTFGGIDVFIDAHLGTESTPMAETTPEVLPRILEENLAASMLLTSQILGYFRGRKRGRMIYLLLEPWLRGGPQDTVMAATRGGLPAFVLALSKQVQDIQVSVNTLTLGMTEEYLLQHYPGVSIKEALEQVRKADPHVRITELDKVSNVVIYLASTAGAGLTGQNLRVV